MSRFKLVLLLTSLTRGGTSGTCLPDAIPESARKYIQDSEGKDISLGILLANWASSFLLNTMTLIWIQEVLGYHSHFDPRVGVSGASAIFALAGCTNFDDATTRSCGENETLIHVSTDTWIGSYAATEQAFAQEYPQIAGVDMGGMGYFGEESIYLAQATMELGQEDVGLALDFYKSYNASHHNPKKYFSSLSDVDPSELALCSDTDFSNTQRMNAYARFSGDEDGMVQQSDGSYIARCPDGRWWPAPACRSDLTKCIPTFTASPGWKLQAMMQWTAAYGFPAAIAISNVWGNFEKHVRSFHALHYWWVPDATFVEMLPQPVVFPQHVASEWAEGNKKTGGTGSYVSKMVSHNLRSKAPLVQEFVGKIKLELTDVQDLLLTHKQSGASDYFDVACNFIKKKRTHPSHWTAWIPDKTQCSAQFGLYNEETQQFVQNRDDPTNLICLACPSGHYSAELQDGLRTGSTFVCRGCPAGTMQPSGASLACDPCPQGEYQDEEATSSCKRCEVGTYQNERGQSSCTSCPRRTTTLGFHSKSLSDCGCKEGKINTGPEIGQNGSKKDFECTDCGDGLSCPFSSTLQKLRDGESELGKDYVPHVLTGYYTPVEDPLSVYRCEPVYLCPPGPPGVCLGGLQGTPCAICLDGQFFADDECKDCAAVSVLWPMGIVVVLGSSFLFYYTGNMKVSAQASPIKVGTMAIGMALNVMQTLALMGMMTVEWPEEMESTSLGLQFMVLDLQLVGGQCFLGANATARYTVLCLFFPILVFWMLCCSLLTRSFLKCGPFSRFENDAVRSRTYSWTWPKTFNIIGLFLQAGFSTTSALVLQPMMCYSHPNGMRSLLKYPNVMCGESEQGALLAVGMVTGGIFVLAFYAGCVVAALKIPSWSLLRKTDLVMSFRFLMSNFRLNRWWFGLLVMARGFCFGLTIVIATDTPAAQTSLASLVLVIYGSLQAVTWPWKAPLINVADLLLSFAMLLLVGRTKMKEVVVARENDDWNFIRIFTLMVLIGIAITIALMLAASLCAILLYFFSSTEGAAKKRKTGRLTSLGKLPSLDTVALALQDTGETMRDVDVNELIESLAEINHYDLKVILQAVQILTMEVLTSKGTPTCPQTQGSITSLRVSRVISEEVLNRTNRSTLASRMSEDIAGTPMSVADSDMPEKNDDESDEKSNAPEFVGINLQEQVATEKPILKL